MKLNTNGFSVKCQHPLTLALAFFPLGWLFINGVDGLARYVYLFPAAYALLAWACVLIPGKWRLLAGLIGAAALAGMGLSAFVRGPLLLLFPALYIFLLFMTLPIGGWEPRKELNLAWQVIGLLTHLLMQLLIDGSRRLGADVYGAAATPVLVSFLLFGVLVVLSFNRTSLENASMSRRTVPLVMRRANTVIVIGLLALGVLIAAIPAIGGALAQVWDWIVQLLLIIGTFLSTIMPQNKQGSGGGAPGMDDEPLSLGKVNEPSALAVFLEKMMGVFALVVAVGLLLWFLWAVGKKLIQLGRYLWRRWGQYSAMAGEDYEDEITCTRDESDVEREGLLSRLRRIVPEDDKAVTANERIRSRYKRLKRRRDWSNASTARETLPESAAALYERVRYGGESLTEADAEAFREGTKKV